GASNAYRGEGRLDYKVSKGIKMSGEITLDQNTSDPYFHNWNTTGYTARLLALPELRENRFQPGYYAVVSQVIMFDGPWYQESLNKPYIHKRDDPDCQYCLLPISNNRTVRAVRVVDFNGR